MIGDCFSLVDRGDRCDLVRVAFDLTSPGYRGSDELCARALLGELRLHEEDGGFLYHVFDVRSGEVVMRPSAETRLELWDRRHAALVEARADVRRAREALESLGVIAPYLTLHADGVLLSGREPVPSVAQMHRLRSHWKAVRRQRLG